LIAAVFLGSGGAWGTSGGQRWEPDRVADFIGNRHQLQFASAVAARWQARRFDCWLERRAAQPVRPASPQPDQPANSCQLQLAIGAHPAVIADLLKTARQNVPREGSHELIAAGPTRDPAAGARRSDAKGDSFFVDRWQSVRGIGILPVILSGSLLWLAEMPIPFSTFEVFFTKHR